MWFYDFLISVSFNVYISEQPPRPPSLDEAEIKKMEKNTKKDDENSKDYLEPEPGRSIIL